jgi:hypothetical protein
MNDIKHETKQNASHTPGPWRYESTPEGYDIKAERSGVLVAYTGENHIDEANARLIATAPRLLSAGEAVLANWERGDLAAAVRELADAIAEAKGLAA